MDLLDNVFDDLEEQDDGPPHELLAFLQQHLPEGRFQLVLRSGKTVSAGEGTELFDDKRDRPVLQAGTEDPLSGFKSPDDALIQRLPIAALDATLIFSLFREAPLYGLKNTVWPPSACVWNF